MSGDAPRYVAIITDGNGRWAAQRGLAPIAGHEAGADVVRERMKDAARMGVKQLTVYSFSTENWSRPADEVEGLLRLFADRLVDEVPEMIEVGIRLRFVGSRTGVPQKLLDRMDRAEERTRHCEKMDMFVAFNYGARAEILQAAEQYQGGGEEEFRKLLHVPDLEDPDLLIRTSGEQRISNYLLWQCAYAEFVFREELWPDFTREAFVECFDEYSRRQRRFGGRVA
ncbi:MAG: polyprenyl diphosphate synthase [Solirubrobacteraceae bacterium]|nr:polyprenyl diphosphate synthase [Solirubrobacteraceae bacterium]